MNSTNPLFFSFQDFDLEIAKKIDSLERDSDELLDGMIEMLTTLGLDRGGQKRTEELYLQLRDAPFDEYEPNYLNHPIRVTASWLMARGSATYDDVALGLCHNIRESAKGTLEHIEKSFLSAENRKRLARLTIDRAQEKSADYLTAYYDAIAMPVDSLIVLKGFDKLDNKLMYPLFDVDAYHFDVVLKYVCPRLHTEDAGLADYLSHLAHYVGSDNTKMKFRKPAS